MQRSLTSGSPSTLPRMCRCLPSGPRSSVDQEQVYTLADMIDPRYRALVLLGAFGGLRWGELAGLRRGRVAVLRSG
jgi:integrase